VPTSQPDVSPVGKKIAIVGASGYVGLRLAARLAGHKHDVVTLARRPVRLTGLRQAIGVDVGHVDHTAAALQGITTCYYLVHSMAAGADFVDRDRRLATAFVEAAKRAGVQRIVYLGGLGRDQLSAHLASRQDVGEVLRGSGIPVVELRAAVILGAGSISFEMLRFLTERLPVMICPRWVRTRLQPLAESDLLDYLEASLEVAPGVYEVGTPDVTEYVTMMQCYAEARGLPRRHIIEIPFLTPRLSAHWVDLVCPVDRRVSHTLIESLVNEVVVREPGASAHFQVKPVTVRDAIARALEDEAERVSSDLFGREPGLQGGVYTVKRSLLVEPYLVGALRANLGRVGGDLRWYGLARAWRLRIAVGRLFGEHLQTYRPESVRLGAAVDWWTVTRCDEDHLVLATRDWFCGDAWLGYRVISSPPRLEQVAALRPKGLLGLAYWRMLWPVHFVVFRVMARGQVRRARLAADAARRGRRARVATMDRSRGR
jgi:uncharacterized protein YbjT (DUF2867 family)